MRSVRLPLLVCTSCLVFHANASDAPFGHRMQKVAPNVYAFVETERRSIVSGTVIAVIGNDAALIFDTTHHVSSAREIIAQLHRLTDKPVRYVINSHWHEDHWTGNAEFAAAFPSAVFYAHPFTAEIIQRRRESFRGESCKAEIRAQLGPIREQLATGKRPDGTSISPEALKFREQAVREGEAQIAECDLMRYRGIDVTFANDMTIALGGISVQLKHLGRGNTAGDVVAYVPERKILVTGDLVVAPFPFATQAYIREWAAVLDQLNAIDADIIVPGHGNIMHDKRYMNDVAALLRSISAQVHAIYRPGMTLDQMRSRVDIKRFRDQFAGTDAFIGANFDNMMNMAIDRAVQEEQGAFKPEG